MHRQCSVKTLALDAGSLSDFGDALGLGEVAQGNEQNAGLVFVLQSRFEVFGGKIRVLPEPSDDGLFVRNAGFAFHAVPVLIFVIVALFQRPRNVCGLLAFVPAAEE
jgi:hypothetical protein